MFRFLLLIIPCILLSSVSIAQFTLHNLANTGEPVNKVTSLAVLNSGYVYVGTENSGVVQFDGINSWVTFTNSNSILPNNYITSFHVHGGDLWVGTQYGGIGKYNGSAWSSITMSNSSLPGNEVWGMYMDVNGYLHIATYSGFAIDSISKSTWRIFDAANTPVFASSTESFYAVVVEPSGTIWLGTEGSGLAKFSANTWTMVSSSNSGLPDNTVNVIKRSSNGDLWIGTNGGLAKFDGASWTSYTVSSTGGLLPGNQINAIEFDNDGNIVAGTSAGIGFYDLTTDAWKAYTTSNSNLPENNITALALDPNTGEIWIGTATQGVAVAVDGQLTGVVSKEAWLNDVVAYPNPTENKFVLQFNSQEKGTIHACLYNAAGIKVKELGNYEIYFGEQMLPVDISDLQEGVYFLVLDNSGKKLIEKIRKQ